MGQGAGFWVVVVLLTACTPPVSQPDAGVSVVQAEGVSATILLGTIDRGFGAIGLTMLALVDDEERGEWSGEILDEDDAVLSAFIYGAGEGRWVPSWWPTVPASLGARYTVRLSERGGRELRVKATLAAVSGLGVPALESPSGSDLTWPDVAGAAAYECATAAGAVAHRTQPGCTLPENETTLTVRALNIDLSSSPTPGALPPSFDLSESVYTFARSSSGSKARAALGAIQYTDSGSGFAALVSVQTSAGTAPTESWEIEIAGPALGPLGVLQGTQLAGTDRVMLWTYDAQPVPGLYEIRARSGAETLSFTVRAAPVAPLPEVSSLVAEPRGSGGAAITWQPVAGARGYYVSAWARDTGVLIASAWVTGTSTVFQPGTFTSGQSCDVYVAASSADPSTGSLLPSTISLSENTYRPVNFVSN